MTEYILPSKRERGTELLIVGIDPGTTTGLALLDLDGQIVKIVSRKGVARSDIIKTISKFGDPLIIATDRNPSPKKVEKIAAAFFAKLAFPRESLTRLEKAKLVDAYFKKVEKIPLDRHKRDSLAAALFARNRIKPLIQKINKKLEIYKQHPDYQKFDQYVKAQVLLRGENINSAIKQYLKKYV